MTTPPHSPLPIDASIQAVRKALAAGGHVVLIAPPGAGKSTRLPLALVDEPWLAGKKIVLVLPRRLAALGAARRMANELGEGVGETVGHRVRFDTKVGQATRLEVVTDGVFTRMIADDPELAGIGCVMFDEVHERALAADLGLAFALEAQSALRPDLRLTAMSATVDGAKFQVLLEPHGGCQRIESDGSMFPVATHHEPSGLPAPQAVTEVALDALRRFDGDGLIFLPGQREIETACGLLREALGNQVAIHALYGAVTRSAQDEALRPDPSGRRKLVVASAIAETSITIPGVQFVVDSGLARRPIYDPVRGITRLETKPASRASIDQRRGRAGRTAPGDCIRLWRREEEGGRPAEDRPEILDADLAKLRLDMALWGALERTSLPFLDPPPESAWEQAGALLKSLGALDAKGAATAFGARMAKLPTHPRLAALLERANAGGKSDAAWAALLAGELNERGPLDGAERLRAALQDRRQAKALKTLHTRLLGRSEAKPPPNDAVLVHHLLHAYPDLIAKRDKDDGQRAIYKLAQGMQAGMETHHPLASEPFLLVLDLGGGRKSGAARVPDIRLALPLSEDQLRDGLGHLITRVETRTFDHATWSVRVRDETRIGALMLAADARPRRTGLNALSEIASHLRSKDLESLTARDKAAGALLSRHQAFHASRGESDALLTRLEAWLPTLLESGEAPPFPDNVLEKAWRAALDWEEAQAFDKQWPASVALGSDQRARIAYDHPAGPTISVRPQMLYGRDDHPTLGADQQPVLIELLSPAQRPIALTADLPAFWRKGWKDVRKDMRARHPKHDWPEEPWKGPTKQSKNRGS
ncbi:MAG: ATP-dependent helicase HrpB [Rhizobiales bacterium]|nr:ATP-dependent helicase HrpB [Hyphomicrobiales bacterium]MBO6699183.1 ATP-dependent helicase HrpB [Hyphomicrobiales bacterium]MBO6736721.1 ATP-dependent helicase HrpB [Hyphomicrobiales bacterium]MBO6912205.1 ATP-dependent helicase HrpB [Hyphomicrobiales bacterium]MBO6956700.1 ATP-dependent helicase HrpB [Hyphomicrobiales bacterium]